jgi:hypothetical protein
MGEWPVSPLVHRRAMLLDVTRCTRITGGFGTTEGTMKNE